MSTLSKERWRALMSDFGFGENLAVFEKLVAAHNEKHRAYHTHMHITACLAHLDAVKTEAEHPANIELALWFHDAVYKPLSSTNEEDSADWAAGFLKENSAQAEQISRIHRLIMITKHHRETQTPDEDLMIDIDLSILGSPANIYDQFEKDVRQEYRKVPGFIFKKKRKEILKGFLDHTPIYKTAYFQKRLERQAHINLARAIARL